MFGTLRPKRCHLSKSENQTWDRLYCGSCQTLGQSFGLMTRVTLSYDQVFLATFIESLQERPSAESQCRCPIAPWQFRPTLDPETPSLQIAASLHVLLVDQWLYDQQLDRAWLWGWIRTLTRPLTQVATHSFAHDESFLQEVMSFSERQAQLEKSSRALSLREAAAPTARLLGMLLQKIVAPLTSITSLSQHTQTLARFGEALGSVIYLIDALEDLERDLKTKQYNVCLKQKRGYAERDEHAIKQCIQTVTEEQEQLQTLLHTLPLKRNRKILEHLIDQLRTRITQRCRQIYKKQAPQSFLQRCINRLQKIRTHFFACLSWTRCKRKIKNGYRFCCRCFDRCCNLCSGCELDCCLCECSCCECGSCDCAGGC